MSTKNFKCIDTNLLLILLDIYKDYNNFITEFDTLLESKKDNTINILLKLKKETIKYLNDIKSILQKIKESSNTYEKNIIKDNNLNEITYNKEKNIQKRKIK